jgi:hypothetical protein
MCERALECPTCHNALIERKLLSRDHLLDNIIGKPFLYWCENCRKFIKYKDAL